MKNRQLRFLLAAAAIGVLFAPNRIAAAEPWQSKVDPWVLENAAAGQTEFIVFLDEQADLGGAARLPEKTDKGRYVFEILTETASRTQGPVLAQLEEMGLEHRPYWVANFIWVRGGADAVQALAEREDVARIYANPWVAIDLEAPLPAGDAPSGIEWNITRVNADEVWAAGVTGAGAVIAGADTGYDWDHPALKGTYRGWNGAAADHNYQWHDAIHSGGGSCGSNTNQPCDDLGHGTHTMGTMVGDDGGSNQIGMSPGAKWIGCRNMNVGVGSPTTYSECFQWFIAPTDLNDQNPNPALAPHVINNSWSCPPSEGCTDPNVLRTVVENTRAAGIVVVVSAGNSGLNCSTVNSPIAIYEASFTVGSTTSSDLISGFSSRGPVTVDGSYRLKPDISAPGSSVRSSYPGTGYAVFSGTSMAAPHVAGLVGLLVSAVPDLAGEVDTLETLIETTALELTTTQECGGIPGSQVPNNTFGHGRIDALAAYEAALGVGAPEFWIHLPFIGRTP